MGLSAQNLVEQFKTSHDIDNIVSSFDPHEKFIIAESRKYLGVYLHFDTRPQDVLKAYFFAVSYLQDRSQLKERYWEVQEKWNEFLNMAQNEGDQAFSTDLKTSDNFRIFSLFRLVHDKPPALRGRVSSRLEGLRLLRIPTPASNWNLNPERTNTVQNHNKREYILK